MGLFVMILYYCICCKTFTERPQFELRLLKNYLKNTHKKQTVRKTLRFIDDSCAVFVIVAVGLLHGDISQMERNEIISAFKKKEFPILVATDVAGDQWLFWKGWVRGRGEELQSTQHRRQWQGNSAGSQNWGLWCEGQCDGEIYTYGEREKTEHIQKVETNPGFLKTGQCKTTCAFLALMLLNQQQTVTVQWQWRPWMGKENLAGFAWTFSCPSKSGLMFFRRNSW